LNEFHFEQQTPDRERPRPIGASPRDCAANKNRRNLLTGFEEQYAPDPPPVLRFNYLTHGSCNCTNTWKKLINRGDVFEIVVRSAVCNDVLEAILNEFNY
jgi:hypothetical protein